MKEPMIWELEALKGMLERVEKGPSHCPRATSVCELYDSKARLLASAVNGPSATPCSCNTDPVDTKVGASSSCLAVHAEVGAMLLVTHNHTLPQVHTIITTRAPCRFCLPVLLLAQADRLVVSRQWEDRDGSEAKWTSQGREWVWA